MTDISSKQSPKPADGGSQPAPARELPPAAQRALAEAAARRAAEPRVERPKELGGPKGPEPVRYGDWEIKGRASDF